MSNLRMLVLQTIRRHNIAPSRFGRDAVGDPAFVADIRSGREARPKTDKRVRTFIATLDRRAAQ